MRSRGPAIGARVGEPGTCQVRGRLATLTPYTANLWGTAYALNEDLDLMQTGWARLPLAAFHRAWPEPAEQDAVAHLLDAWDVRWIVPALRTPQEMLPEMRAGKAPDPAAIQQRPVRVARFRAPAEVMFHRDLPSAIRDAQRDRFSVELREHVISGGHAASWSASPRRGASQRRSSAVRSRSTCRHRRTASSWRR